MTDHLNHITDLWWDWMFSMFWQVGLLIVLVALIDLLIRKWAWPQLRYALWLLILVKLMLPPSLTSPTSLTSNLQPLAKDTLAAQMKKSQPSEVTDSTSYPSTIPIYKYEPTVETLPSAVQTSLISVPLVSGESPAIANSDVLPAEKENLSPEVISLAAVEESTTPEVPAVALKVKLHWKFYLMLTWALGVWIFVGWFILHWRRLTRQVRRQSQTDRLPDWFFDSLRETTELLGLRRIPRVAVSSKIATPAVFGLFRPTLLMPTANLGTLSRRDARHVLLHELAHIKRRDPLIHTFNLLLQIVYWYNPLLWLMRRQLQHLRELCCDATVARVLKENTPAYRETLLETAKRLLTKRVEPGLGLLGLFENSNRLVTRLKWLEKNTWKHTRLRFIAIVLVIAAVSACILPMAQGGNDEGAKSTLQSNEEKSNKSQLNESPYDATKQKIMNLVEDFFRHNYKDISSRKTLEWGEPVIHDNGNVSIRYKAEVVIWGKDKMILEQIFTFDNKDNFVSAEKIDRAQMQVNPEDKNRLRLQIQNMKVKKLPEFITAFTGKTVIMEDDRVGEHSITIHSQQEITKDQAFQLIRAALKLKQIQLEERDGILYLGSQPRPPAATVTPLTSPKPQILLEAQILRVPTSAILSLGPAQQTEKGEVTTLVITADRIDTLVKNLKSQSQTQVISNPQMIARASETAELFSGHTLPDSKFYQGLCLRVLPNLDNQDRICLYIQLSQKANRPTKEEEYASGFYEKQVTLQARLKSGQSLLTVLPADFLTDFHAKKSSAPTQILMLLKAEILPAQKLSIVNQISETPAPAIKPMDPMQTDMPVRIKPLQPESTYSQDRPWQWYLALEELRNLQQKKIEAENQLQQALIQKKEQIEIKGMNETHPQIKHLEQNIKRRQQEYELVRNQYEEASWKMRDLDEKIMQYQQVSNQIRFLQQQQQKLDQRILDTRIEYESAESVQEQKKAEFLLPALQKQRDRVETEIHLQQEQLQALRRQMN